MEMDQLKALAAKDLLALAEELEVEDAGSLSRQEMLFAVLREAADNGDTIYGGGTLEILSDGFGFLRVPKPIIWQVRQMFTFSLR